MLKNRSVPLLIVVCFSLALVAGCSGPAQNISQPEPQQWQAVTPPMILQPGDGIEIKFQSATDLNDSQTIRPDGMISLPMVGEIMAAGTTPGQLTATLNERFAGEVQDPRITVIVRSIQGRRIFLGGEVKNPGVYLLSAPTTAYEAVVLGGGFIPESAQQKKIAVVRNVNGQRKIYVLDMHTAQDLYDFYLEPRDIVFVPRQGIVKADDWVAHYITKLIPQLPVYFNMPLTSSPLIGK